MTCGAAGKLGLVSTYQQTSGNKAGEDYMEWEIEIEEEDNCPTLRVTRKWIDHPGEAPDTFEITVSNLEEMRFFHVMLGEAIRHTKPVQYHDKGEAAPSLGAQRP